MSFAGENCEIADSMSLPDMRYLIDYLYEQKCEPYGISDNDAQYRNKTYFTCQNKTEFDIEGYFGLSE